MERMAAAPAATVIAPARPQSQRRQASDQQSVFADLDTVLHTQTTDAYAAPSAAGSSPPPPPSSSSAALLPASTPLPRAVEPRAPSSASVQSATLQRVQPCCGANHNSRGAQPARLFVDALPDTAHRCRRIRDQTSRPFHRINGSTRARAGKLRGRGAPINQEQHLKKT